MAQGEVLHGHADGGASFPILNWSSVFGRETIQLIAVVSIAYREGAGNLVLYQGVKSHRFACHYLLRIKYLTTQSSG